MIASSLCTVQISLVLFLLSHEERVLKRMLDDRCAVLIIGVFLWNGSADDCIALFPDRAHTRFDFIVGVGLLLHVPGRTIYRVVLDRDRCLDFLAIGSRQQELGKGLLHMA